jgi:hypothetical protein
MSPVREDALFIILYGQTYMSGRNICTVVSVARRNLKPNDISGIISEGFVEKLVNSDESEVSDTFKNRDSDYHDQEDSMLTVDRG